MNLKDLQPEATGVAPGAVTSPLSHRFHNTVRLNPVRVDCGASRIADDVTACRAGHVRVEEGITLEIEASLPDGASDQIVRTVTENSQTLKFTNHGPETK
jgi:hypothetical protein